MVMPFSRGRTEERRREKNPTKEDLISAIQTTQHLKSRLLSTSIDYALTEALEEVLTEETEIERLCKDIGQEFAAEIAYQAADGGAAQVTAFLRKCQDVVLCSLKPSQH